jgi:hypothetical protein
MRTRSVTEDLVVLAISRTQWRVSDATKDECDGLALLGFIEQDDDKFEVTTLGKSCDRTYLPSFNAALDRLSQSRPGDGG